jgi:hypothetical protein
MTDAFTIEQESRISLSPSRPAARQNVPTLPHSCVFMVGGASLSYRMAVDTILFSVVVNNYSSTVVRIPSGTTRIHPHTFLSAAIKCFMYVSLYHEKKKLPEEESSSSTYH